MVGCEAAGVGAGEASEVTACHEASGSKQGVVEIGSATIHRGDDLQAEEVGPCRESAPRGNCSETSDQNRSQGIRFIKPGEWEDLIWPALLSDHSHGRSIT